MTGLELKAKVQKELEKEDLGKIDRKIGETIVEMIDQLDHAWTKTLAKCKQMDAEGQHRKSSLLGSNVQQRIFGSVEALTGIAVAVFPDIKASSAPAIVEEHEKGVVKP